MLTKAMLIGVLFASAPVYLASSQNPEQEPLRDGFEPRIEEFEPMANYRSSHAARIEDLERRHADQVATLQDQLAASQLRVADLERQLEECMDFIMAGTERHSGCKPSRRMMTHYMWLKNNGHGERAQGALDRVVAQVGSKNSSLNRAAWYLMTEKDTAGQYDELALALAERMQGNGGMDHREMDTVALAKFLNGRTEEAIELQKKAIKKGGKSGDYCRRLRTYEAALQHRIQDAAEVGADPATTPAKPARKISDDDEE